ncbi:MAG: hypothetical protein ACP5KY_07040, partial [Thermoproteus sp.]
SGEPFTYTLRLTGAGNTLNSLTALDWVVLALGRATTVRLYVPTFRTGRYKDSGVVPDATRDPFINTSTLDL